MDLTPDELKFLASHKLVSRDVFDARGMSDKAWKSQIRIECKKIALGNPCTKGAHRLKTRSGHCVQCSTIPFGFQKRNSEQAEVYIAFSKSKKLTKVGSSKECYNRIININRELLGGASDWVLLYKVTASQGAKLELCVHKNLKDYRVKASYLKEGKLQSSRECFSCTPNIALQQIESSILECDIDIGASFRSPLFEDA